MNLFPTYSIKNLLIKPALVLSPMSGVTCSAFRRLIKELNPNSIGLMITEFISAEALTRFVPRSLQMMKYHSMERPIGIQIFGYDVSRMRDAALMAQEAGADVVDINCGCPAPKVVRKGGGCELMRQPKQLAEILKAVRAVVFGPLTIKIRAGWDSQSQNAVEIARIAESEGVDALAIHGRTKAQMYRGEANWDLVTEVARAIKIPVFGSGDVLSREHALKRLCGDTGVVEAEKALAGLYIGRASLANPFIFQEIVTGNQRNIKNNETLVVSVLARYADLLKEEFPASVSVGRMKQLASQMCRSYPWRKVICTLMSFEEQCAFIASLSRPSLEASSIETYPMQN